MLKFILIFFFISEINQFFIYFLDTNKENKLENLNQDITNLTFTNIITILREFLISKKNHYIHE